MEGIPHFFQRKYMICVSVRDKDVFQGHTTVFDPLNDLVCVVCRINQNGIVFLTDQKIYIGDAGSDDPLFNTHDEHFRTIGYLYALWRKVQRRKRELPEEKTGHALRETPRFRVGCNV